MLMSWGELVLVTATYFQAGEHPWTQEAFFDNSVPQCEAAPTIDPIVLTLWDSEGPRVAENDNWWEQIGIWWGLVGQGFRFEQYLPLDDNLKLTAPAVCFHFMPLTIGAGDRDQPPRSMLTYLCDDVEHTFEGYLDELKDLCDQHRKEQSFVSLLTLWQCEAGWSYIPGEPSEYDMDWQLMGAVLPKAESVVFELLQGDIVCEIDDDPPLAQSL